MVAFRRSNITFYAGLLWSFANLQLDVFASDDAVRANLKFNRDIRPILSDNCFGCHGPDKHSRQADLRLDNRESAIALGAIDTRNVSESGILLRVEASDGELLMPPLHTGKALSNEQKQLLRTWIEEGGAYETHWSFLSVPRKIEVPHWETDSTEKLAPIDAFIAYELKRHGLDFSPSANRSTWLRRVSIDLTGLPPTIEELNEFETSKASDAYEQVVDRLLASETYGERMATIWLDVARYADTFGYQADVDMDVWPWRDWVIRAFNENLGYDDFVLWQTAGDLLPNATRDQKLATTFNRLHRQTNEGGSIEEEFRQVYISDRTTTNATAFLGLTFECARCHDHKYDPILQKDFYQLAAYFSNIDEHGLYSHFTRTAPTPALLLYEGDQEQRHRALLSRIEQLSNAFDSLVERAKADAADKFDRLDVAEQIVTQVVSLPSNEFKLEGSVEGVAGQATLFNGDDAYVCENTAQIHRNSPWTMSLWIHPDKELKTASRALIAHQSVAAEDAAFRGMQLVLNEGRPEFSLVHFWPGNALRVLSAELVPFDAWTSIVVTYDGTSRAKGIKLYLNGKLVASEIVRDQLTRDIDYRSAWGDSGSEKLPIALGARFRDTGFRHSAIDELKIFDRQLSYREVISLVQSYRSIDLTNEQQKQAAIDDQVHRLDEGVRQAFSELHAVMKEENEFVATIPQIMTMQEANTPRKTFVLARGAYDSRAEEVQQETPSFLLSSRDAAVDPSEKPRLQLARWLIHGDHPLTSRVAVNRFWHNFFGRGLVTSLEDFGSQGQVPSHPELLDWLARDFISSNWDVKTLCKKIVLSKAYRQDSRVTDAEKLKHDPYNRLISRGPHHRLSAEQLRDGILYSSRLLVKKIGGPSVMPYQPEGLWEESGTGKSYAQSTGDGLHRRSLYTFWRRTAPPPNMLTFDATSRETCTAKRETTATPLQSLVLLNDLQYVEAARNFGEHLCSTFPQDISKKIDCAFRTYTSRFPDEQEALVLKKLYEEQIDYFQSHPESAKLFNAVGNKKPVDSLNPIELAATSVLVSAIINFDETISKR